MSKKAAPFVAAGISAITGAGIIVTAASSAALMGSLFGIAGGGLAGNALRYIYYIMKKKILSDHIYLCRLQNAQDNSRS